MFDAQHSKQPKNDRSQAAPAQEPSRTKQNIHHTGDLTRIPLYTQWAWGNQPPPWLLPGIPQQALQEGEPLQKAAEPTQHKENTTSLPATLKAGVEHLSGLSMDDVQVHYNSSKPAQVQALAYTQGRNIHVGPGQEKHLPHEAWHVVQQKEGRVHPTIQAKGMAINDDEGLEREAYVMGEKATRDRAPQETQARLPVRINDHMPLQRVIFPNMSAMWAAVEPLRTEAQIMAITNADTALTQVYTDVSTHLAHMDFIQQANRQPEASMAPTLPGGNIYQIHYGLRVNLAAPYNNITRYIGAILHEMMHITAGHQYTTNAPGGVGHVANMNLPVAVGNIDPAYAEYGLTDNQMDTLVTGMMPQLNIMLANWDQLRVEADLDQANGNLTLAQATVIRARIAYAKVLPGAIAHYDTVLTDLLFYLRHEGVHASRSYEYAHRMLTEANARRLAGVGTVQAIPPAPLPIPAPPQQSFFQWLLSFIE